jgi:hypothetical protein
MKSPKLLTNLDTALLRELTPTNCKDCSIEDLKGLVIGIRLLQRHIELIEKLLETGELTDADCGLSDDIEDIED